MKNGFPKNPITKPDAGFDKNLANRALSPRAVSWSLLRRNPAKQQGMRVTKGKPAASAVSVLDQRSAVGRNRYSPKCPLTVVFFARAANRLVAGSNPARTFRCRFGPKRMHTILIMAQAIDRAFAGVRIGVDRR